MKKIITLLLILFGFGVQAQQQHFNIEWKDTLALYSNGKSALKLPKFQEEYHVYNDDNTISFVAQWKENKTINPSSLEITNVSYTTVNPKTLGDIVVSRLPKKVKATLQSSKARNKRSAILEVSPIINNNGTIQKVTSFDVSYNYLPNARVASRTLEVTNSILSSGTFYKFYIEESGVFRLDANFLGQLGFSVNSIDPRKIKIYGNGGRMLPLVNQDNLHYDAPENAIMVVGESDGVFDSTDYILFYGEGPEKWNDESQTHINAFTDRTYYYITVEGSENGKRITEAIQPAGAITTTITTFDDYQYHELDNINIVRLGRRWFGDIFNLQTEQTFDFEIPNLVTSEPVKIGIKPAAIARGTTSMSTTINGSAATSVDGSPLFNFSFGPVTDSNFATQHLVSGVSSVLRQGLLEGEVNLSSETLSIGLDYNNAGIAGSTGYLDYITVEAKRELTGIDAQFAFTYKDAATMMGIGEYVISNATNISQVWDITDIWNVSAITNATGESSLAFTANLGEAKQYLAIDESDYLTPSIQGNTLVENQNLKGTVFLNASGAFEDLDYIIVTPEFLVSQAQRLADFHTNYSGLHVKVVTLEDIYAEFNTGNPDVGAIRNLIKYVYDNATSDDNRLKYLCLFGDASFDYKERTEDNNNIVPVFHAFESFNLTRGFMTDDFYGMMDPTEGTLSIGNRLDVAVGRMLVSSVSQAKDMVDKVIAYHDKEAFGRWRNTITIISDDADNESDSTLQFDLDELGDVISANKPFINVKKIHSDAFVQQSSAGGDRYPAVTQAIKDDIALGVLVANYFGHGGEDGLAVERIFEKNDGRELQNDCRLPVFITITCEYTRFDNPLRETAGEFMYWNNQGGAVSLLTTTRQIFQNIGVSINKILAEHLFSYGSTDYISIAEALRITKNAVGTDNKRTVFCIGDPAMKLAIPRPQVNLTAINDVPITSPTDTLKALSYVKIAGNVTTEEGALMNSYNGTIFSTIYDKRIQRQTLSNDFPAVLEFQTLGEIIFRGKAEVVNGNFEFDFIVPRDIAIPVGNGRISFYAEKEDVLEDHTGYSEDLLVGELNEDAPEDNAPPTIQLFMNDESFVSGGVTNESPFLLAKLADENGINTASGIGHDIVAFLDGDEVNPFVLNDYYETELNDYTKGLVKFPFRDLEEGLHTITLKAWDVYNNSSTSEIEFMVFNENNSLTITNLLNYPNPFVSYTEFWFNHNSSSELDIMVQIFTVSGKVVRTLTGKANAGASSKSFSTLSRDVIWDGKDDFGDKLGKGVYVYKITVKSPLTNKKVEKFEKLVIL